MASDRETLSADVVPVHYTIFLRCLARPARKFDYDGEVTIELDIKSDTKEIVLNTIELKILSAELTSENDLTQQASISYQDPVQRTVFAFDKTVNGKAILMIRFEGNINGRMAGFYRSRYKPAASTSPSVPQDKGYHYMLSTQFESYDARRAIPCFDEPNKKATFDVKLAIPEDLLALSNMPVKETECIEKGFKVVTFERTPRMSTYLLAWAVGDFEYVEDFTRRKYLGRNLPVRVYTTKGLKEQARFALENAHKILDFYSDTFSIEYPLPKLDLLAVHEFSHNAMENWGLVTYRTTAVLFDETKSDQKYKNRVAYVVAHELAHQWFGNLVTMDWWNELWLNEGFATWVGWLAIDHFYPEWNVWGQFVGDSVQRAFQLDSLRNSHPIEVSVKTALEVEQVFDHISYLKGCSVIRMLSSYLTVNVFLQGVSSYLKMHAYGNASTNDLWSALSEVSGQNVEAFMTPWIKNVGFPVITVAEEPQQISVRQSRFLLTGDVKPEEDHTIWWVPLGLAQGQETLAVRREQLMLKDATLRDIDDKFYKLNLKQTGFFRTNYPPGRLMKLGSRHSSLSTEDNIGLIGDSNALAIAGHGKTAGVLALIENFKDEENYLIWSQIITCLNNMQSVFAEDEEISRGIRHFVLNLVTSATKAIGWEFSSTESYLEQQLRALLIATAGLAKEKGIVMEAKRRFDMFINGKSEALHPNLRSAVFRTVISANGAEEFEALQKYYEKSTSVDGKEIILQSLGQVTDSKLAERYLNFLFSPEVTVQDVHSGASSLAANPKTRHTLWNYIKTYWDSVVYPKLSSNMVVLDRFLRISLTTFADEEIASEVRDFFENKDNTGYDRSLGVIEDSIKSNAAYKKRDADVLREWLSAHGYLGIRVD